MLLHLGFKQAVLLAAVGLSVLFALLLELRSRRGEEKLFPRQSTSFLLTLSLIEMAALLLYSFDLNGPRAGTWFGLQIATAVTLWLLSLTGKHRTTVIVCSAALVATTTIGILHAQGIGIVGEDQWRDVAAEYDVLSRGNLDQARGVMGGYYSVIPALPIVIPLSSTVTGLDLFSTNDVLAPIFAFMGALALIIVVQRITGFVGAPPIVAILIVSGSRLYIWLLQHQQVSIVLTAIALLLLHRAYLWRHHPSAAASFICLIMLVFALNATHPSGTIAVLLFLGASLATFVVLRRRFDVPVSPAREARVRWLLVAIATVVTAYWLFTNLLDFLGQNYLRAYALEFYGSHPYRVPLNSVFGDPIAALGWALPVALTVAYLYYFGVRLVRKQGMRDDLIRSLPAGAYGMVALVVLVGAFASWSTRGSEGSFERYLSVPAYILLTISAVAAAGAIARRGRLPTLVLSLTLIGGLVGAAHSLEWAPDLHQDGAFSTRTDFQVARNIADILPSRGRLAPMTQIASPLQYQYYVSGRRWSSYEEAQEYALNVGLDRDVAKVIRTPPRSPASPSTFVILEAPWLQGVKLPVGTDIAYSDGKGVVLVPHSGNP